LLYIFRSTLRPAIPLGRNCIEPISDHPANLRKLLLLITCFGIRNQMEVRV